MIALSSDRSIKAGETRVLRFVSADISPPVRLPWWRSIINVPKFEIKGGSNKDLGYSEHVVIVAPLGFEIRTSRNPAMEKLPDGSTKVLTNNEHYYENRTDTLAVYTIPSRSNPVEFSMVYGIYPEKEEMLLFRGFFVVFVLAASIFSGLLLGAASCLISHNSPVVSLVGSVLPFVGSIFLALGAGFLGTVTNPLTHRTKLAILIPLARMAVTMFLLTRPPWTHSDLSC